MSAKCRSNTFDLHYVIIGLDKTNNFLSFVEWPLKTGGEGGGGLVALLGLSSWCLVKVGQLFLAVPRGCLRFVIVVFPDLTHLLFLLYAIKFNGYPI